MRGHWESQTRKLNKHYQSGRGGLRPAFDAVIRGFPIMQLPVISGTLSLSTQTGALRIYAGNRAGLNSLLNTNMFSFVGDVPLYVIPTDAIWTFGGLRLTYEDIKRYIRSDTRFTTTEETVTFELYSNDKTILFNTVTINCCIIHYVGVTLPTNASITTIPGIIGKPHFSVFGDYYGVEHKYKNIHIFSQDGKEGVGDITKTNVFMNNMNVNTKWRGDFTFTENYNVPPESGVYFTLGGQFEYNTEASEVDAYPRDQLVYGYLFDDNILNNDVSPETLRGGNYPLDKSISFQGVCKVYCDSFTYTDTRNGRISESGDDFDGSVLGTTANYLTMHNREV